VNTDLLRHCALPPHPHKIEPHEIPLRRYARFIGELGVGGLYDAFLQIKNDELVYFGEVVDWLITAIPGLDRGAVITRFQPGVRYREFGFRGRFGQTTDLLDLDNFSAALPVQYALRPFIGGRTRDSSEQMRARKSRWATWLSSQGWPVPGWLAGAPVIEGKATVINVAAPGALPPAPAGAATKRQPRRNKGGHPPARREDVIAWYESLPEEDRERCSNQGLAASYVDGDLRGGDIGYVAKLIRKYRSENPG
jgi:hypothetical protein